MKLSFRQSGGFAGLLKGIDLDTGALEESEARELEALARASGIEGAQAFTTEGARDLHRYEITIEHDDGVASLSCDDGSVPAAAGPLLRYLRNRARPMC